MPDASGGASSAQNAYTANSNARALVLAQALDMIQSIANATITPSAGVPNVINVQPRNVGLVKEFVIELSATVTNSDGANALTITPFGPANLLSSIIVTDLQNINRVQTSGWHLAMLATVRRGKIDGAAYTTDSPIGYGSNFAVISAPSSITHGTTGTVKMIYRVPLAYSDNDLRGAVYANVINATFNLQFTLNPIAIGAVGADPTTAMYTGAAGSITSLTYNVYQRYLDQLPTMADGSGVILPQLDLSTIYDLKNTAVTGMSANQEFPIAYSNYRSFLSTLLVYDNGGVLNVGSDINYLALQAANLTYIRKIDPILSAFLTREAIGDDLPKGTYLVSTRNKPVNTVQYGNLEIIVNPSSVAAGAQILLGYEAFSQQQIITGAGSLTGG